MIHKHKKPTSGFTLIELLVVIAIIGILSSVVLSSINNARDKGANVAVKANLHGIKNQAEIVYDDASPYSYDAVCDDTGVINAGAKAVIAGGGTFICNDIDIAWAASTELKVAEGGNGFWCIDSEGTAKSIVATLGTDTVCP